MHSPLHFVPVNTSLRRQIVVIDRAFSTDEMDRVDRGVRGLELEEARVGPEPEAGVMHDRRYSRIAWLAHEPENAESAWLYGKCMALVHRANVHFGLDIWGFAEPLQYAEYPPGGRYCWHMDCGISDTEAPRPPRKVSFTLQLSHAEEYRGGELEFLIEHRFPKATRDRGTMIVFPSYMAHRVEPVTDGTRRSLVGWVCGQEYR